MIVESKAREGAKAMSLAFVLLDFQHVGVRRKKGGRTPATGKRYLFTFMCALSVLTLISVSIPPPCYCSST